MKEDGSGSGPQRSISSDLQTQSGVVNCASMLDPSLERSYEMICAATDITPPQDLYKISGGVIKAPTLGLCDTPIYNRGGRTYGM